AFTLYCNARGAYHYERKLLLGLDEQVSCDGTTLLHLYPELGIGARRAVSRFHRAEFAELVPWVLPPVDDLARGADVRFVDEHTIAIVPTSVGHNSDPSVGYLAVHLIISDGNLAERRYVWMPENKLVARETYSEDAIRLVDASDKELWSRT